MDAKITCIIVDDEPIALNLLEGYVAKTPFLQLKDKCESAIEALEVVNSTAVDLIFLDIQMPELNGIEFSKLLSKNTRVIFTTAYDKYAIEGFKVDALDYLLKPFSYQEFLTAAMKAKEWFGIAKSGNPVHSANELEFIFVKSEYKQIKIVLSDVLYFEGMKDYVKIWVKNEPKPIMSLMSLKSLEEVLPPAKFMRVHRSFIISLKEVQSVERGNAQIRQQFIPIADQYKHQFQDFLDRNSIG
jgi:two-component system, LytTR family, response regulator LytT